MGSSSGISLYINDWIFIHYISLQLNGLVCIRMILLVDICSQIFTICSTLNSSWHFPWNSGISSLMLVSFGWYLSEKAQLNIYGMCYTLYPTWHVSVVSVMSCIPVYSDGSIFFFFFFLIETEWFYWVNQWDSFGSRIFS